MSILQLALVFVRTFFEVKILLVQCLVSCLNEMDNTSIASEFKVLTSDGKICISVKEYQGQCLILSVSEESFSEVSNLYCNSTHLYHCR
jgi:hypothetical protein